MEYSMLLMLLVFAFLAFQKYLVRGMAGRWKAVGDSFGYGKQYDPETTVECAWSEDKKRWYDPACYEIVKGNELLSYRNNCVSRCVVGDFGACGGVATCGRWGFIRIWKVEFPWFFPDEPCCFMTCNEECQDEAAAIAVDRCPGPADAPCNDPY